MEKARTKVCRGILFWGITTIAAISLTCGKPQLPLAQTELSQISSTQKADMVSARSNARVISPLISRVDFATTGEGGGYKAYTHVYTETNTNTYERKRVYRVSIHESPTIETNIPLKGFTQGIDIRRKGTFTITKEGRFSSCYSVTQAISSNLKTTYGASAEVDIGIFTTEIYTEFAKENSSTYSNSLTTEIGEVATITQTYDITDSSEYGFYIATLNAFQAKKYKLKASWTDYVRKRQSANTDWDSWNTEYSDSYETYYYIPIVNINDKDNLYSNSIYVSADRVFSSTTEYREYMDSYHAIY